MRIKKILITLFLILLSYFVYSLECSTISDCDDDNYCTIDSCSNGNCSYTNITGCIKENFVSVGDTFRMGLGPCRDTYEFDNVYENKIILLVDSESIELIYDNTTSNQYGYPVNYNFNILNNTVVFNLRYNLTQNFLYLENVNKSCPVNDSCSTNEDCNDDNACTIDECDGTPLACVYNFIAYCRNSDGCCPSKCNATEDNDCITDQCAIDANCDDNDPCTIDICNGTPKLCTNIAITNCITGDNCCPTGCIYNSDNDCEKPIVCGDNVCEVNETKENCCKDCGCDRGYGCVDNSCQKTGETITKETIENDENFKKKENKLIDAGFSLKEVLFLKTGEGFDFNYVYKKDGKERAIIGSIDEQNNIISLKTKGEISTGWYVTILLVVFLITIATLSFYRNIKLKKEKEKESYYSRLLQQRFRRRPKSPFYRR